MTPRRVAISVAVVVLGIAIASPVHAATSPGAPQGNVTPSAPAPTNMGVAAVSAPVDGVVAILLQNGSSRPRRVTRVQAIATRVGGGRATRERSVVAYPQVVGPGEYALASVKFDADDARPDAKVEVTVQSAPASTKRLARALSVGGFVLSPPQTGSVAQTMQATLTNGTFAWTARRPETAILCFGEASNPSTFAKARATNRRVAPGDSTSVTIPLTSLCPSYLVAARTT